MLQNDSIDHLIAYMKDHQKALGLTVREYADLAHVTIDTINNIYYKKVDSVKIDVAARLVHAVNGSLDEVFGIGAAAAGQSCVPAQAAQPAAPSADTALMVDALRSSCDQRVAVLERTYQKQQEELEKAHKEHLRDVRFARNLWAVLAIALLSLIIIWFIWDITHPRVGLIQYDQLSGLRGLLG